MEIKIRENHVIIGNLTVIAQIPVLNDIHAFYLLPNLKVNQRPCISDNSTLCTRLNHNISM